MSVLCFFFRKYVLENISDGKKSLFHHWNVKQRHFLAKHHHDKQLILKMLEYNYDVIYNDDGYDNKNIQYKSVQTLKVLFTDSMV